MTKPRRSGLQPRIPILALMGIVAFVAVVLGSMRRPSMLWSSTLYSALVAALSAAPLAAAATAGRTRLGWAGFAVFGWVYMALSFGPWPNSNGVVAPPFLTAVALEYVEDHMLGRKDMTLAYLDGPPGQRVLPHLLEARLVPVPESDRPPGLPLMPPTIPPRAVTLHDVKRVGHLIAASLFAGTGFLLGHVLGGARRGPGQPGALA